MVAGVPKKPVPLVVALLACGCAADPATTLDELAAREGLRLQATVERDVCSCSCGNLVCWNFSCTGEGCSRADEFELSARRVAANGECLDGARGLSATLVAGADTVEPSHMTGTCGNLTITWRGLPAGIDLAQPHRVEISDESAVWTIERPFTRPSAVILAPASAASAPSGAARTLRSGVQLVVGWSKGVTLAEPRATLEPAGRTGTPSVTELEVVDAGDHRLEIRVPSETSPALYELTLSAETVLAPGGCVGPPLCRGLDLHTTWELRVE